MKIGNILIDAAHFQSYTGPCVYYLIGYDGDYLYIGAARFSNVKGLESEA